MIAVCFNPREKEPVPKHWHRRLGKHRHWAGMSSGWRRGKPTDLPTLVTLSLDPIPKRKQRPPYQK